MFGLVHLYMCMENTVGPRGPARWVRGSPLDSIRAPACMVCGNSPNIYLPETGVNGCGQQGHTLPHINGSFEDTYELVHMITDDILHRMYDVLCELNPWQS